MTLGVLAEEHDFSYGLPGNATAAEWRAKYVEAADMLQEARGELEDFMTSSKELEEELLRELERTEKTQKELKDKVNGTEVDRDNWKVGEFVRESLDVS